MKRFFFLILVLLISFQLYPEDIYSQIDSLRKIFPNTSLFYYINNGNIYAKIDNDIAKLENEYFDLMNKYFSEPNNRISEKRKMIINLIAKKIENGFNNKINIQTEIYNISKFGYNDCILFININIPHDMIVESIKLDNTFHSTIIDCIICNFIQPQWSGLIIGLIISINGIPIDEFITKGMGEEGQMYSNIILNAYEQEHIYMDMTIKVEQ